MCVCVCVCVCRGYFLIITPILLFVNRLLRFILLSNVICWYEL